MTDTLCPECRNQLVGVARAALSVLADEQADDAQRRVAGDVAAETIRTLRLPPGRPAQETR
jgi:hypothetical protein